MGKVGRWALLQHNIGVPSNVNNEHIHKQD